MDGLALSPREAALELANETRMAGVEFRRGLRQMDQADAIAAAARVIEHGAGGPVSSQFVEQVLRAIPGFGPGRVGILLETARVRVRAHIRDLTPAERATLTAALRRPIPLPERARRARPPSLLPSGPLVDWLERHYRSPEAAAKTLGVTARTLRHMRAARHVRTETVENLLTRAPIGMHDLYPPDKYPGLYA